MSLNFVNKVQKEGVDYDVNDIRIPDPSIADASKAVVVDAQGNYTLANVSVDAYTKSETDALLADKADTTDVYTKAEVDSDLALKADASNVYTKAEVDADLLLKANAADVYTKAAADEKFALASDLASKQDTLVSGTNIKTINSTSILGEGDISIKGDVYVLDLGEVEIEMSEDGFDARAIITEEQYDNLVDAKAAEIYAELYTEEEDKETGELEKEVVAKLVLPKLFVEDEDNVIFGNAIISGEGSYQSVTSFMAQLDIDFDENDDPVYTVDMRGLFARLTTVEANPEVSSSDPDLTSIKINGTEYKIPSGGSSGGSIPTVDSVEAAEEYACEANVDNVFLYTGKDYAITKETKLAARFSVTIDNDTFMSEASQYGDYEFEFDGSDWNPAIATYGITVSGSPISGDKIVVTYTDPVISVNDVITDFYVLDDGSADFSQVFESGETYPSYDIAEPYNGNFDYDYITINAATFGSAVNYTEGYYQFTAHYPNFSDWYLMDGQSSLGTLVNLADYGLSVDTSSFTEPEDYYFEIKYSGFAETCKILGMHLDYFGESMIAEMFVDRSTNNLCMNIDNYVEELYDDANKQWSPVVAELGMYGQTLGGFIVDSVVKNNVWKNWLSKVELPAISSEIEYTERIDVEIGDSYSINKGSVETLVYHDNKWQHRFASEGTSLDELNGASSIPNPVTIYYNTLLSTEEAKDILVNAGIIGEGGSGTSYNLGYIRVENGSGSSIYNNEYIQAYGAMNEVVVRAEFSDAEDHYIFSSSPMFGLKGWASSSDEVANVIGASLESQYKSAVDKLFSLTPFTYSYEEVDLSLEGLTITGDPVEGDMVVISVADNGYKSYTLYRVAEQSKPIAIGDTISTIYFDTTKKPTAEDFKTNLVYIKTALINPKTVLIGEMPIYGLFGTNLSDVGEGDGFIVYTCLGERGFPDISSVVYSDTEFEVDGTTVPAGWSVSSYTYPSSFVATSPVTLIADSQYETDCDPSHCLWARNTAQPQVVYTNVELIEEPEDEVGVIDVNIVLEGSPADQIPFTITKEDKKKLKTCKELMIKLGIGYGAGEEISQYIILPLLQIRADGALKGYIFSANMVESSYIGIVNATIVPDYDGGDMCYLEIKDVEIGGGSQSGGTQLYKHEVTGYDSLSTQHTIYIISANNDSIASGSVGANIYTYLTNPSNNVVSIMYNSMYVSCAYDGADGRLVWLDISGSSLPYGSLDLYTLNNCYDNVSPIN